ncbi:MAG: LD-carboxypeptidase [Pseudobdellovibrionaceae bacterium]|jgi:muramoyltetrapeptide carboxypeptidase LdcA involved in peptidoglycan recycling|nr:LD-carboxypeptidase [Pseudobdellovibrionaceae bacterium]
MKNAMNKPRALSEGCKIAIVSPSWGGPSTFPHKYEAGLSQLKKAFAVEIVEMPHTKKPAEWLHLNPKARADDLMQAFEDTSIDGIIASIGGDDAIRLLPFMNLDVIAANPKVFIGYSDTTTLHFACLKAGLTSFYGPSIMAGFGESGGLLPYMEDAVRKTIFTPQQTLEIGVATEWTSAHMDWSDPENQKRKRPLQKASGPILLQGEGIHQGRLIGGCIDVFPMIIGTALWPKAEDFNKAILFLETSEEAPSPDDVKRILRNLGVQGILENLTGIIIGRPGGNVQKLDQYDVAIQSTLSEEFGLTNLPVLAQMDFGHTDPMCVLPYGISGQIDCTTKRLTLLEPACII